MLNHLVCDAGSDESKCPDSTRVFACSTLVGSEAESECARTSAERSEEMLERERLTSHFSLLYFVPNQNVPRLAQQQRTYDYSYSGDDDRIVDTRIDIAGLRNY